MTKAGTWEGTGLFSQLGRSLQWRWEDRRWEVYFDHLNTPLHHQIH